MKTALRVPQHRGISSQAGILPKRCYTWLMTNSNATLEFRPVEVGYCQLVIVIRLRADHNITTDTWRKEKAKFVKCS